MTTFILLLFLASGVHQMPPRETRLLIAGAAPTLVSVGYENCKTEVRWIYNGPADVFRIKRKSNHGNAVFFLCRCSLAQSNVQSLGQTTYSWTESAECAGYYAYSVGIYQQGNWNDSQEIEIRR
jgi:hypothetical protein